jgi:hypothetical protein
MQHKSTKFRIMYLFFSVARHSEFRVSLGAVYREPLKLNCGPRNISVMTRNKVCQEIG